MATPSQSPASTASGFLDITALPGKRRSIAILLLCEVAGMAVWFSSAAAVASIGRAEPISASQAAWLTSMVQAGFVAGTLASASLCLADRLDSRRFFMACCLIAAALTASLSLLAPTGAEVLVLRFLTGMCMAGVYPIGMRMAATWATGDLGLLIGLLVGALTLGSASPHLLGALGSFDWRHIYLGAAAMAAIGGIGILFAGIGPAAPRSAALSLANMAQAWRSRPVRLANLGYLGHMWELYAMWAWMGAFLHASFRQSGMNCAHIAAEAITFAVVGVGAAGAWMGGFFADRYGRTTVTIVAMAISGSCAATIGWLFGARPELLIGIGLLWGMTVVADSAQFSASIAELAAPGTVGTLLTVQTCGGFLLTLVSIQLLAPAVAALGWGASFSLLALGPMLGCIAMARLRASPDAARLAGGRR